jgi:predicted amidophosphoribosyltransferase
VQDNLELIRENITSGCQQDWEVIGSDVNWEDADLFCDHCGEKIESAYDI